MMTRSAHEGAVSLNTSGRTPVTRSRSSAKVDVAICKAAGSDESVTRGTSAPWLASWKWSSESASVSSQRHCCPPSAATPGSSRFARTSDNIVGMRWVIGAATWLLGP